MRASRSENEGVGRDVGRGQRRAALWLFPVLLFLFAWFFHLGGTGPWSDDWFFQFTSPVTGEPMRHVILNWTTRHHRPLHHMLMPFLQTSLADVRWLAVLITAAGHGLAAYMLWRLLRALGFSRLPRDGASLLWLVYPVIFDIPLWVAAVSTGFALAIAIGILELALRVARGASAWLIVPIVLLAYIVCALNEQPAAVFAALPVIGFVYGATWKERIHAAIWPTAACAVGVGLYLVLSMGFVPGVSEGLTADERGSSARLVTRSAELREEWNLTKDQANRAMWMEGGFLRGAVRLGMDALLTGPRHAGWGWSVLWIGGLLVAAMLRVPRLIADVKNERAMPWQQATRLGFAGGIIGLLIFFAGFVPVLIVRDQDFYTRLACVPAIGLAVCLATSLEIILRNAMLVPRLGAIVRVGLALALGFVLGLWSLACVGMQEGLHRRVLQDQNEAEQLRELIPNPPEGACIIFCQYDHLVSRTGHPRLDPQFLGAVNVTWATTRFVQRAYKRWDVLGVGVWRGAHVPVLEASDAGLRLDPRFAHELSVMQHKPALPEPYFVPWDRAVLVRVDADGVVRHVTRAELQMMVSERAD